MKSTEEEAENMGGHKEIDVDEQDPAMEPPKNQSSDESGMRRLKDWLLGEEESMESWLGDGGDAIPHPQRIFSLSTDGADDNSQNMVSDSILIERIEELRKENSELRARVENVTEGLPSDQASIMKKEMELMDLENSLREKERGLEHLIEPLSQKDPGLEARFQEELREKEEEFRKRETEFTARIDQLEKELEDKESETRLREEELRVAKMSVPDAEKEFEKKYQELQKKETFFNDMEEEIRNLKAHLVQKDAELKKISDLMKFKDKEFGQRDDDLLYRERKLEEERRRFEEAKKEASGLEELEMKKRLEALKEEVQAKENEIRNREKYLNSKEAELRRREKGIIEEEIEASEEERTIEIQQAKVRTGNRRLDDLLLGGIPFGSNILVHGPPFTGKEVMIGQFVSEGLSKGIPCIWVITDKTPSDIRGEMNYVLSGYEEYEKLGLIKYIDTYSLSMGQTAEDEYTIFLEDPTDHNKIMEIVEATIEEFKNKGHEHYRLAFRSLSTLIAYSDPISAFRFLSPFCGRRKRDKAVSMFAMEKGMHSDQEIQMIGSVMDGMIDFKVDQLKTFFAVKGVTDVQSRSYIRYTASKSAISIGSFSLDHIR